MTFQPSIDSDTSRVAIQLAPGATLEQTEAVADEVTDLMKRDSLVESALSRIDVGTATVYLKLRKDRELTYTEFEKDRAPRLAAVPDARNNLQSQHPAAGGSSRHISNTLRTDGRNKLHHDDHPLLAPSA